MATARDLTIYRGDTYSHTITVVDGDDAPVDLSDRTWTAQWRSSPDSRSAENFTIDTSDASTGVLILTLSADQTTTLPSRGTWDLQGTFISDGAIETLLHGVVTCTKDVTRS